MGLEHKRRTYEIQLGTCRTAENYLTISTKTSAITAAQMAAKSSPATWEISDAKRKRRIETNSSPPTASERLSPTVSPRCLLDHLDGLDAHLVGDGVVPLVMGDVVEDVQRVH